MYGESQQLWILYEGYVNNWNSPNSFAKILIFLFGPGDIPIRLSSPFLLFSSHPPPSSLQKHLILLIKGLCTGCSRLDRTEIITFTAMMKSAKLPQTVKTLSDGESSAFAETASHCINVVKCTLGRYVSDRSMLLEYVKYSLYNC